MLWTHRKRGDATSLSTRRAFDAKRCSAAAIVALMAGVLGLSACGGSDADSDADAGGGSTTASSDSRQDRAQVRLAECLREQGIDLPDPGHVGVPPENQAQLDEALAGRPVDRRDRRDGLGARDRRRRRALSLPSSIPPAANRGAASGLTGPIAVV